MHRGFHTKTHTRLSHFLPLAVTRNPVYVYMLLVGSVIVIQLLRSVCELLLLVFLEYGTLKVTWIVEEPFLRQNNNRCFMSLKIRCLTDDFGTQCVDLFLHIITVCLNQFLFSCAKYLYVLAQILYIYINKHWRGNVDMMWCFTFGGFFCRESGFWTGRGHWSQQLHYRYGMLFIFPKQTFHVLLSKCIIWLIQKNWVECYVLMLLGNTHCTDAFVESYVMFSFGLLWQTTRVVNIVVFHIVIKCHWLCRLDMIFMRDIKVALDGRSRFWNPHFYIVVWHPLRFVLACSLLIYPHIWKFNFPPFTTLYAPPLFKCVPTCSKRNKGVL